MSNEVHLTESLNWITENLGPLDVSAYYTSNQPFYLTKDVNHMVETIEICFLKIPSSRDTLLQMMAGLIHEDVRYFKLTKNASCK